IPTTTTGTEGARRLRLRATAAPSKWRCVRRCGGAAPLREALSGWQGRVGGAHEDLVSKESVLVRTLLLMDATPERRRERASESGHGGPSSVRVRAAIGAWSSPAGCPSAYR